MLPAVGVQLFMSVFPVVSVVVSVVVGGVAGSGCYIKSLFPMLSAQIIHSPFEIELFKLIFCCILIVVCGRDAF